MEAFIPRGAKLGEGYSKQEITNSMIHPGRRTKAHGYQSAVSFISDLIELRRFIILCGYCRAKFKPRDFNYRRHYLPDASGKTDGYVVNGQCDWCKVETVNTPGGGTGFVPEEAYAQICHEPKSERARARAAAKQLGVWVAIQRQQRKS